MGQGRSRIRALALVLFLAGACAAATAPAASAAVRYVTPGGSTHGNCPSTEPCDLQYAVETVAQDGDEVVVGTGSYQSNSADTLTVSVPNLYIHGQPGRPRPLIPISTTGDVVHIQSGATGVTLSDLHLRQTSSNASATLEDDAGSTLQQLEILHASPNTSAVIMKGGGRLLNSVVVDNGNGSNAAVELLDAGDFTVLNDTLQSAAGAGVTLISTSSGAATALVRNTITDGVVDVVAQKSGSGSVTMNVDHSNLNSGAAISGGTVNQNGGNQGAAPHFVGGGDLSQAPSSPTIDAGTSDPLAGPDLDGEPRPNGAANDIGADEFYANTGTRYASTDATATGGCSTPATACSLTRAVLDVPASGDEVVVEPGHYALDAALAPSVPLNLHGAAGRPAPVISGNASGPLFALTGAGNVVRGLELRNSGAGPAIRSPGGSQLERLVAVSPRTNAHAVELGSGDVLTNSVAWAPGDNARAVFANTGAGTSSVTLRGVTAMAPNGGGAFAVHMQTSGIGTLTVRNTIARGGGADVRLTDTTPGGTSVTDIGNSNFRGPPVRDGSPPTPTFQDAGGNQSGDPLFADAAGGDFHELAASPTVNAGTPNLANGPFDVDGDARAIGAAPDIGADELLVAPAATTGAATGVGATEATLNGTADPEGQATTAWFEFGPTTSYGSRTTDEDAGAGTDPAGLSAAIAGLAPGTTFHYRAVARNATGTTRGDDMTFTTAAIPAAVVVVVVVVVVVPAPAAPSSRRPHRGRT